MDHDALQFLGPLFTPIWALLIIETAAAAMTMARTRVNNLLTEALSGSYASQCLPVLSTLETQRHEVVTPYRGPFWLL